MSKNGIVNRLSEIEKIIEALITHEVSSADHLEQVLKELSYMTELYDYPSFQFIQSQLQLLLTPTNHLF